MVLFILGSLVILVMVVAMGFYCYRRSKLVSGLSSYSQLKWECQCMVLLKSFIIVQQPHFHQLQGGNNSGANNSSSGGGGAGGCSSAGSITGSTSASQHTAFSTITPTPSEIVLPVTLHEIKAKGRFGALWRASCNNKNVAVKIFPSTVSTQDHY